MLLLSFFGRENLTGAFFSMLIRTLHVVIECSSSKHGRSISLCEVCLDCQCHPGGVVPFSSGASSFPFSLTKRKCKLIPSQSRFLDGRKRRRKHRHGHRLTAGVLILSSFSPTPAFTTVSTTPTP